MIDRFQNIPIFRRGQVFVNSININEQFFDDVAQPEIDLPFEPKPDDPETPPPPTLRYKIPTHLRNFGKYFIKYVNSENIVSASEITLDLCDSYLVTVTSINGFFNIGTAKNVLKEEVVNSNKSDVYIAPETFYTPIEITVNFFCSDLWSDYWLSTPGVKNQRIVLANYEYFLEDHVGKMFWIKSIPHGMYNLFVCTKASEPTSIRLGVADGQHMIVGKLTLNSVYDRNFFI